jgi:hypothetical protein
MTIKLLITCVLLVVFLWITPAFAQWVAISTAEIPFEFSVGTVLLPAGNYAVQTLGSVPSMIRIRNVDTGQSAQVLHDQILIGNGREHSNKSQLVFTADESGHVLHQVVLEGDNHIHDLIHGKDVAELVVKTR